MPKLPVLTGRQMIAFLESQGFQLARIHGSHHFMRKGSVGISVPVHGARTLKIGTMRGILREAEITPNQFVELWKER